MGLTMKDLEDCFESADFEVAPFIGVKIQMEGLSKPEIIINPRRNFSSKLSYYKKSYNEDLTLKVFNGIRIIGFSFGYDYAEIQDNLLGEGL